MPNVIIPMTAANAATWKLNGHAVQVFKLDDGYCLFVEWSPSLTLVSRADFSSKAEATKAVAAITKAGVVDLTQWLKCTPNTAEKSNPDFPAYSSFSTEFQVTA